MIIIIIIIFLHSQYKIGINKVFMTGKSSPCLDMEITFQGQN